jgi:hypothetical protein
VKLLKYFQILRNPNAKIFFRDLMMSKFWLKQALEILILWQSRIVSERITNYVSFEYFFLYWKDELSFLLLKVLNFLSLEIKFLEMFKIHYTESVENRCFYYSKLPVIYQNCFFCCLKRWPCIGNEDPID